jgi:hypothetical protein
MYNSISLLNIVVVPVVWLGWDSCTFYTRTRCDVVRNKRNFSPKCAAMLQLLKGTVKWNVSSEFCQVRNLNLKIKLIAFVFRFI